MDAMLLDCCISLDTWITFNLSINDAFGTVRDTVIYITVQYVIYVVNKVADKAAVCNLILNLSWGLLMQHSLKQRKHSKIRTALVMKEMHIKIKHIFESEKNHPFH